MKPGRPEAVIAGGHLSNFAASARDLRRSLLKIRGLGP
jgi:hypothetical protein